MDESFAAPGAHGVNSITQVADTTSTPADQNGVFVDSPPATFEEYSHRLPHNLDGRHKANFEKYFPRILPLLKNRWSMPKGGPLPERLAYSGIRNDTDEIPDGVEKIPNDEDGPFVAKNNDPSTTVMQALPVSWSYPSDSKTGFTTTSPSPSSTRSPGHCSRDSIMKEFTSPILYGRKRQRSVADPELQASSSGENKRQRSSQSNAYHSHQFPESYEDIAEMASNSQQINAAKNNEPREDYMIKDCEPFQLVQLQSRVLRYHSFLAALSSARSLIKSRTQFTNECADLKSFIDGMNPAQEVGGQGIGSYCDNPSREQPGGWSPQIHEMVQGFLRSETVVRGQEILFQLEELRVELEAGAEEARMRL
ncbi:hypothetical protein G7046_g6337 [Stylonectria norvegica]|nr:hypothetical protein G7046_g6337 [Stylonectria norvegica]